MHPVIMLVVGYVCRPIFHLIACLFSIPILTDDYFIIFRLTVVIFNQPGVVMITETFFRLILKADI